jgi:hypothetical protein
MSPTVACFAVTYDARPATACSRAHGHPALAPLTFVLCRDPNTRHAPESSEECGRGGGGLARLLGESRADKDEGRAAAHQRE